MSVCLCVSKDLAKRYTNKVLLYIEAPHKARVDYNYFLIKLLNFFLSFKIKIESKGRPCSFFQVHLEASRAASQPKTKLN